MNLLIAAAAAATFAIHDFTPDFWRFWETAQNQPLERQAQLWRQLYVAKHQTVFDDLAQNCEPEWNDDWFRAHYLPELPKVVPAMRTISAGLGQQLDAANRRFLQMFPDMQWAGDIYFMASGFCFDGRSQTIQGRSALLFGVDAMAGFGQKSAIPVMHHELFHRYHRAFFEFEVTGSYPLWTALWAEGLATYVAKELNPSASELDRGMVPLGMVERVDDRRAELAADFLRRFESTVAKDATVYFNGTNSKDAFVPARAGYELGALVAGELSKQYSLQTMAHWSQADAKPKIRAALEQMSVRR
ncbi:MAG TPA: hypothetical protein VH814_15580 [Steroidobacteraceae bacterium]|jgi:hypothetical protein